MSRASNDLSAVKLLVGFGAVSLMATMTAFVGTLAAMLVIDPWLTLYAMAP
jgi:ABC-type multidrug transport system fused ATPase/permease subunit